MTTNKTYIKPRVISSVAIIAATLLTPASSVFALDPSAGTTNTTPTSTQTDQQRLANIKTKGDQEISRRLTTLGSLSAKVNAGTKLSASDKAYLNSEVSTEANGLTTLKVKLDGETTLAAVRADAQGIFNDYRVYALIVPKIALVKFADTEQVTQGKLEALVTKLQTRLDEAKSKGKDITSLQAKLNDMTAQTSAAQAISSSIEAKVLTLQPSDYNTDHAILSGDRDQLKVAHSDNLSAIADAKSIIESLKSL